MVTASWEAVAGRWVVLTQCSPAVNHKPLPPGRSQGSALGKLLRPPGRQLTLGPPICPGTASPRRPQVPEPPTHSFSQQPGCPVQKAAPTVLGTSCQAPRGGSWHQGHSADPRAWDPAMSPHTDQRVGLCLQSRWGPGLSVELDSSENQRALTLSRQGLQTRV